SAHRHLHSFPTRRSSDLFFIEQTTDGHFCCNHKNNANEKEVVLRTAADAAKILKKIKELRTETSWAKYLEYDDLDEVKNYFITRSEEHTSELQSRENLVC